MQEMYPGGQRGWGPANLETPGRLRKTPGYLSGHKRQIHGVTAGVAAAAAAAPAPVLAVAAAVLAVAAAGPASRTVIRERTKPRAGALGPRRP